VTRAEILDRLRAVVRRVDEKHAAHLAALRPAPPPKRKRPMPDIVIRPSPIRPHRR